MIPMHKPKKKSPKIKELFKGKGSLKQAILIHEVLGEALGARAPGRLKWPPIF